MKQMRKLMVFLDDKIKRHEQDWLILKKKQIGQK